MQPIPQPAVTAPARHQHSIGADRGESFDSVWDVPGYTTEHVPIEEHTDMNRTMKAIATGAITAAAGIGVGAFGAEVALAHHNTVSGVSACQANGTYTITWTITNSEAGTAETVSKTAPAGGTFAPAFPIDIAAGGSANTVQTGIPGSTTSVTLAVHGAWINGATNDAQGTVELAGDCVPNISTPVAPTVTVKTECGVKDTFTAGPTTGVVYTPTSGSLNAGNNPGAVVATPAQGYVFSGPQSVSYDLVGSPIEPCTTTSTPVAPTVTTTSECGVPDSFTAGPTTGVVYTPSSGTLGQGVSVDVIATPAAGYSFVGPQSVTYTLTGGTIEVCSTDTTAATTTTLPATTTTVGGVSEEPATTVNQVAPPVVGAPTAPDAPITGLPETGSNNTVTMLLGGFALVAGAAMLAAVRRRSAAK